MASPHLPSHSLTQWRILRMSRHSFLRRLVSLLSLSNDFLDCQRAGRAPRQISPPLHPLQHARWVNASTSRSRDKLTLKAWKNYFLRILKSKFKKFFNVNYCTIVPSIWGMGVPCITQILNKCFDRSIERNFSHFKENMASKYCKILQ